jgi:hypothetical protein
MVYLKHRLVPRRVVVVVRHARSFRAPSTLAPWGHDSVPSGCYVCPITGSTCGVQVVCPHPPSKPNGELGVRCAGPVAMVRTKERNQSVVMPSLLHRASRWVFANRSKHEPG